MAVNVQIRPRPAHKAERIKAHRKRSAGGADVRKQEEDALTVG